MKTLVEKSEIVVDDKGFENLFLDIEDRKVIPFIYVIRKSDKPNELVLKSKIDGSKNPYWKEVSKEVMNCFRVVVNYKERVENELKKEGKEITEYQQGELKGKEHISKCVQYNDNTKKHYLQYFTFPTSKPSSTFEFEGNEIDKQLFESFMVKKSENSRQPQDNKHTPQSLTITNIKEISLSGVHYEVD